MIDPTQRKPAATVELTRLSPIRLDLEIDDPVVVPYLAQFESEERSAKALEAMKVGVIAIQSASPTLDTRIVEKKFSEVEAGLKGHIQDFQTELSENLERYFKDQDGIIPKSLDGLFGDDGKLTQSFHAYFEPRTGKVARLIDEQIGPSSEFGRALDPKNKDGIISLIEKKVEELVTEKLDEVLEEFSLDKDDSAMSRLQRMLKNLFSDLNRTLGIEEGKAEEAKRGHVKGFSFQEDLYVFVAEWGRQLGDETKFVAGTPGILQRKTGDHLITLGPDTGAPGRRIVIEAKDQADIKLKDAMTELQTAKENRDAVCGIYAFAKGCAPPEVGDFRRIGEDFYCTVDKESLAIGGPLLYIEAAFKIARAQAVSVVRREAAGKIDLDLIQRHIDALTKLVPRMGKVATKATTIKNHGESIEKDIKEMMEDLQERCNEVLDILRLEPAGD